MAGTAASRAGGQALVEFALLVPVVIALLIVIFDLGRVIWTQSAVSAGAREGARFAIVHGGSRNSDCPVGPPAADTWIPTASPSCPNPSPSKTSVKDAALAATIAGGNAAVTVCYVPPGRPASDTCSGDTDATSATNARGARVTVTVTSTVPLVTASLLNGVIGMWRGAGIPTAYQVSSTTRMLVNH